MAENWLSVPQYVIKNIEVAFKQIVFCLFEISLRTKYSSVLLELGMMKMQHIITRNQIGYMSQVVWDMRGTMVHDVVMEEFKYLGDKSALTAADTLAERYGFRKISEIAVDRKVLKRVLKEVNNLELWNDCFFSPILSIRLYLGLKTRNQMG